MREVKENFQRIADRLPHEATTTTSASPKRLTALGERVADDLGRTSGQRTRQSAF